MVTDATLHWPICQVNNGRQWPWQKKKETHSPAGVQRLAPVRQQGELAAAPTTPGATGLEMPSTNRNVSPFWCNGLFNSTLRTVCGFSPVKRNLCVVLSPIGNRATKRSCLLETLDQFEDAQSSVPVFTSKKQHAIQTLS